MLMNTSENARKALESKLKQNEEQTKKLEAKLASGILLALINYSSTRSVA